MIPAVAKTWHNNIAVTRVFTTYHSQNAWAHLSGLGWRKIETGSKDGVTNMLMLFTKSVANAQKVDVYVDGSKVYQAVQR